MVDVDMDSYFGCLDGVPMSVHVRLTGKGTVMVLTLIQ